MRRPTASKLHGTVAPRCQNAVAFWRFGALVLRLLLAPVIFLGRGPLRLLLASVAGIATVAAFACLFSIRLALDTGSGLWEPILSAYGMATVAAVDESVGKVLDCYRVLGELEEQLNAQG